MITITNGANCKHPSEYCGLSTDEKPTEKVDNAAVFYEMDTKNLFLFDAQNKVWLEQ